MEVFKNIHLQLSAEDLKKIDEWKISHGMKSRTEAIRSMVRIVTEGSNQTSNQVNTQQAVNRRSMLENNDNGFTKPQNPINSSNNNEQENIEDLVRKIIKQELKNFTDNK